MSMYWMALFAALAVFVLVALIDSAGWYRRHYNDEFKAAWDRIYEAMKPRPKKRRRYTTASFHEPGESKPGSPERAAREASLRESFENMSPLGLATLQAEYMGVLPRNYQWRMDLMKEVLREKTRKGS